jgi:hypothetical protein
MQESIKLFHSRENSQLERVSAAMRRRHEFIDRRTLMLVRAIAGPRACRKRKLLFTRWRMSSIINEIAVGQPSAFRRLHTEGNYAVFVKTQGPLLPDLYVVARLVKIYEPNKIQVGTRMRFVHRFSRSVICKMTVSDEPPSKGESPIQEMEWPG